MFRAIFFSILITIFVNSYSPKASMVISGGVSLGAYEAGYNWTMINLLKKLKYTPFNIDPKLLSIAGASAGSINALISAIYWCQKDNIKNEVGNNLFFNTWVDIGLEDLLIFDPNSSNKTSLFSRRALREKAKEIISYMKKRIFQKGCQIPLGVVVTKSRPLVKYYDSIKIKVASLNIPLLVYEKNSQLRVKNYSKKINLNTISIPSLEKNQNLIANILFASSAFPGAFEQVKLKFKYNGKILEGYFIDGGVFNNIPLDLALALNPTSNFFLFIDPDNLRDFKNYCNNREIRKFLKCKKCNLKINQKESPITKDEIEAGFIGFNLPPLFKSAQIMRSQKLYETIEKYFINSPRELILSSRVHPITGEFLNAFGAFLDRNFREYDYYVGVYDALYQISFLLHKRNLTNKSIPQLILYFKKLLQIDKNTDASYMVDMLLKAEFCNQKPKVTNRFSAIYNAFNFKVAIKNRYSLKGFEYFLSHLNLKYFPNSKNSLLAYMVKHPKNWYNKTLAQIIERVVELENYRASIDPDYRAVARLVDFSAWLSYAHLKEKKGLIFQPILTPEDKDSLFFKLFPIEYSVDSLNGGFSLAYSMAYYKEFGIFDGIEWKLSYNFGKHVDNFVRLDMDPFINLKYNFTLGAGVSLFGNTQRGSFWERKGGFGANIFIDYSDIFRITYVRRFSGQRNRNYLYFGIRNIPALFYWLSK